MLGGEEIGGEVAADRVAKIRLGHVEQPLGAARGVDHRDVQPAEIACRSLEQPGDILLLGKVDRDAIALAHLADAGERVLEMLLVAAADEDTRTFAGEQNGDRAADPGGAARHQHAATGKRRDGGVRVGSIGHEGSKN